MTQPRVAFQGELGAFSEVAIVRLWQGEAIAVPEPDCVGVTRAVECGSVDYGVLAIHNSIAGRVVASHDALLASPRLSVLTQTTVRIRLCLMAPRYIELADLHTVYSHPMALAQCTRFLQRHPQMKAVEAYDSAGAARDVAARELPGEAAIASRESAARYRLRILMVRLKIALITELRSG